MMHEFTHTTQTRHTCRSVWIAAATTKLHLSRQCLRSRIQMMCERHWICVCVYFVYNTMRWGKAVIFFLFWLSFWLNAHKLNHQQNSRLTSNGKKTEKCKQQKWMRKNVDIHNFWYLQSKSLTDSWDSLFFVARYKVNCFVSFVVRWNFRLCFYYARFSEKVKEFASDFHQNYADVNPWIFKKNRFRNTWATSIPFQALRILHSQFQFRRVDAKMAADFRRRSC